MYSPFSSFFLRQTNNIYDLDQEMLDWKIPPAHNYVNGKIVHPLLFLLYPAVYFVNPTATWQTF